MPGSQNLGNMSHTYQNVVPNKNREDSKNPAMSGAGA